MTSRLVMMKSRHINREIHLLIKVRRVYFVGSGHDRSNVAAARVDGLAYGPFLVAHRATCTQTLAMLRHTRRADPCGKRRVGTVLRFDLHRCRLLLR
jgi:hypothetical protein